jgi:hypothetical protein
MREFALATPEDEEINWAEKRKFPRTSVVWSGTLQTKGETLDCLVLNLSANGAKIRLHTALAAADWSGTLSIPALGAFKAKVAWSNASDAIEIGLIFDDPPTTVARALTEALPNSQAASVSRKDDT